MPSRRDYLATVAAGVVGFAGCQADTGEPDIPTTTAARTTKPTTTTSTNTASSTGRDDLSVEDIVVRKAISYESAMGSGGVLAGDDRQYVVASVRSSRDLLPTAFSFATNAESWSPGLPDTAGGVNRSVAGHGGGPVGQPVGADDSSYLAFTVPSPLSASNPRIEYGADDPTTWRLPDAARPRLEEPGPQFELRALDVPDSVTPGDPLPVSLTVENASDADGRFLAALYWPTTIADDNEAHVIERTTTAGETFTASMDLDTEYAPDDEMATLGVRGYVTAERDVDLENT